MRIQEPLMVSPFYAKTFEIPPKTLAFIKSIVEAEPPNLASLLKGPISEFANGPNVISEDAPSSGFYLWTYYRGDLFHWNAVLNKLDDILASIIAAYGICDSVEVYKRNDLNFQQKPFEPHDHELLMSILTFTKLLLENSLSLNSYSSHDRLICLLMTDDIRVVEICLQLLLVGQKRRKSILFDPPLIGFLEVYTSYILPLPDTSHVDSHRLGYLVTDTPETYKHSTSQERLHRVYSLRASQDPQRFELVRLYALALLLSAYESQSNDIFKMFPTIISDTARLIGPSGTSIEAAAMLFAKHTLPHDLKWDELHYALQIDSTNGPLMTILRRIVEDPDAYPPEYLMSFFELLTAIIGNAFFDASFISANFMDTMLKAATTTFILDGDGVLMDRKVYRIRDRLLCHLDMLLKRNTAFSDSFFILDGLHRVTQLICTLINFLINNRASICKYALSMHLAHLLRLIDRLLMTRTDDRMRSMIDGPLFRNLRALFEAHAREDTPLLPPALFTRAMAVLANYIHNEPTCLSILQEQGVTTSLLVALTRDKVIAPDPEMLRTILHAFGALCLNPTGYEDFKRIDPLKQFMRIFRDPTFRYIMPPNNFSMQLGATLDEFCRHHPQLRGFVFEHVVDALGTFFQATDSDAVMENLGCNLRIHPFDLPPSSLNDLLWYTPSRIVLFQAFCIFLETLLRSTSHCTEFHQQHHGIEAFLDVLEKGNVLHYHFYIELLPSIVLVLRSLYECAPELVTSRLINQLKDALSRTAEKSWGASIPDGPFHALPFQNLELVQKHSKALDVAFNTRCRILGLLGIVHDLYFATTFAKPPAIDYATTFWDGQTGAMLPGMLLQAHGLSLEYYHIMTDAKCKQLLEQSIDNFDGHNPDHINAMNLHMNVFLLRHIPSQIITLWSALVKRLSPSDTKAKIDKQGAGRVCQGIVSNGISIPLTTISTLPDSTSIRQCMVMNTIMILNTILFDDSSYKIAANVEIYALLVTLENGLNSLDNAFKSTCEEDTPNRIPLLETILLFFARILSPSVYKTTFWTDLTTNNNGNDMKIFDKFIDIISKWTLIIIQNIPKYDGPLGPNILILLCKLISSLTLQRRSPSQGSAASAPPGEAEFLRAMRDLHSPSNPHSESFRGLFHDLHDLILPLAFKFMHEILAMPSQVQRYMTQELVNNILCRYECLGWTGNAFLSHLLPELILDNPLKDTPLPIRMNILVLLLHASNKARLLNEISPAMPILLKMLRDCPDVRDSAALILAEYLALHSLPPFPEHSPSLDPDDPGFDGGIKRDAAQDYAWQLPPLELLDPKRVFEDALFALQQSDLSPSDVNALLRLVVACLKIKDLPHDPQSILPLLLKHAPKSVLHDGNLLDTNSHDSIPHLISIAIRLMVESQVHLLDYMQLDLVSKYSAAKGALKEGIELNAFVLDSKTSILRDWRTWLEAAKASLVARIPSKAIARAELNRQQNREALAGLVRVHLLEDIKQGDITERILSDTSHSPVMHILIELAFNTLTFHTIPEYTSQSVSVGNSQLDFMCLVGNITELAASYPSCHRTMMNHPRMEHLLTTFLLHASFNALDFDPRHVKRPDYLEGFDSACNCWLHLLLQTALSGSIFDRTPETRKRLSAVQVGWCRLVVDALSSAWSQIEHESNEYGRLAKIHGLSTVISILLDINNPQIGFNDLPNNFGSFGRRQSAVTMMLAAQMIERNVVSILSRHLEYVTGLSFAVRKLHVTVDSTAERLGEALELLSKLASRLGKVDKADLGTLTSKLASMSSFDFSLDSETSSITPSGDTNDESMLDSMSMEDIDDEDDMMGSEMSMGGMGDQDYGYEGELQSEDSSMSEEDEEDEDDDHISIMEMSIDGNDDTEHRHVTFDILSSDQDEDESEDDEDDDSGRAFRRPRIHPGFLENAVMQVLQRSGINPADAPIDIILEQEEEDPRFGERMRAFYGDEEEHDGYDSYEDDDWGGDRSYGEEEEDEEDRGSMRMMRDANGFNPFNGVVTSVLTPLAHRLRGTLSMSGTMLPRNVYATEVYDRPSYNPWADPAHSALEAGYRTNPLLSTRRTEFGFLREGLPSQITRQSTPEIYPHPYQHCILPSNYLELLADPLKSSRQMGTSLLRRAMTDPTDGARYKLVDIEPKSIKWPESKPIKHHEIERSLERAMVVPTHRRWIQLDQVLYSFVSYLQVTKSAFIFDNPSLPYINFSSGLTIPIVPMLREALGAKGLEESVGFTNWDTFSIDRLARGTDDGSSTSESSQTEEEEEEDESMSEETETVEDRHRTLESIMGEVTGQVSSTLVYEDPGIDASFIEAMPFDLLGEAFQQHFAERRHGIRALMNANNTHDWPQITISDSFLAALSPEARSIYEQLSTEDDLASRLFGAQRDEGFDMVDDFEENEDDFYDDHEHASRELQQSHNQAPAENESKKREELEGLPLADPAVLTSILKVHYHPSIGRPKSLFRALLYFCSNRRTRENLLGLLLFILQRCPVDDEALEGILTKFVKKQTIVSPNASGSASKAPSTPKHKEGTPIPSPSITSPTFSHSQTFSQRQVVILQRTLQLLMQLVQRTGELQAFFVQEEHADSWCIKRHLGGGKREPPTTTKSPLVVLLSVIENPVFMRVVNEAGPSGSMVMELLLHLIAIVAESVEKSETCPEVPPFFLQVFARCLASSTELTPRAQTHAIHILQRLTKHPSLAIPLIAEIASLANGSLLDSTVHSLGDQIPDVVVPSEHLLRLMKLFSSMLFSKSPEQQVDSIQSHLTSIESLPSLRQILLNPSWNALRSTLSHKMSVLESEDSRSLHPVTTLLPALESCFIQVRLLLAILKQLDLGEERDALEADLIQFAEKHRRSLNFLIQTNPSLLTTASLHILTAHPRVLDFDNKRILFKQQLHRKPPNTTFPGISLNIRRQYVFEDSFHQLIPKTGDEVKFGKLTVKFHGEEGVDIGGVTREWFSVLTRAMFNPDYVLFKTSASDRITYQPNRLSAINPDHLQFFRFVGRVIGKAIYDNRLLDAYFTRSFYKHMLGQSPDFRDLEAVDPEFHKSLTWTLEHDITGVLDWTFSVETDEFGQHRVIDLIENGHTIPVTEANKREYVRAMTEYKLTTAIKPQIDSFLTGFHEIVPQDLIKIFSDPELELLISGMPDLDVEDWRAHTEYHGSYSPSSPVIQWFWRAVRNFEPEDRAKLLQFVTGTSKVPMEGFAGLQGSGGVQKFQIHRVSGETGQHRLPTAHTCFNQLDLPEYTNYEELRDALLLAISECSTGFGFV